MNTNICLKLLGLVYTACYERTELISEIMSTLIARRINQTGSLPELSSLLTVRLARQWRSER